MSGKNMNIENAVVVVNKTRLEALIERFNTRDQARFYIEHAGGNFKEYVAEHEAFHQSLSVVTRTVSEYLKMKVVERKYVPNFLFSEKDLVVVVGQDGLVANTAKYANGLPILAINPDKTRYDGILLPYDCSTVKGALKGLLNDRASYKHITLAEARTNDGQRLLAFNDFFVGPASHTSARYRITFDAHSEDQSSSGIIVSTGAGSTGWLSSVVNMANGISHTFDEDRQEDVTIALPWDTDKLVFVVREPFRSRHSSISLTAGMIHGNESLTIESYMPSNGVIFSDGVEADFIRFNSGTSVEIGIASQKATLVMGAA